MNLHFTLWILIVLSNTPRNRLPQGLADTVDRDAVENLLEKPSHVVACRRKSAIFTPDIAKGR